MNSSYVGKQSTQEGLAKGSVECVAGKLLRLNESCLAFLHIRSPDLPLSTDPHCPACYNTASRLVKNSLGSSEQSMQNVIKSCPCILISLYNSLEYACRFGLIAQLQGGGAVSNRDTRSDLESEGVSKWRAARVMDWKRKRRHG